MFSKKFIRFLPKIPATRGLFDRSLHLMDLEEESSPSTSLTGTGQPVMKEVGESDTFLKD